MNEVCKFSNISNTFVTSRGVYPIFWMLIAEMDWHPQCGTIPWWNCVNHSRRGFPNRRIWNQWVDCSFTNLRFQSNLLDWSVRGYNDVFTQANLSAIYWDILCTREKQYYLKESCLQICRLREHRVSNNLYNFIYNVH